MYEHDDKLTLLLAAGPREGTCVGMTDSEENHCRRRIEWDDVENKHNIQKICHSLMLVLIRREWVSPEGTFCTVYRVPLAGKTDVTVEGGSVVLPS